jgi:hypothetical protein
MQLSNILNDEDLIKLNKKLKEINLYQILGIEINELVHSNMIAYLLGKDNNIDLSSEFRSRFLEDIFDKSKFFNLNSINLIEPNIHREKYNIDIVLEYPNLTIAIENKILASEGVNQIKRYQRKLDLYYPNHNKFLVFLTPEGRKSNTKHKDSNIEVVNYSYNELINLAEDLIENNESSFNNTLKKFITHIKEDIMGDKQGIEQCKNLYDKYPEAYKFMVGNYQEVLNDKIRSLFNDLHKRILEFSNDDNLKVVLNEEDRNKKIYIYLDIKNENWPEGIFIRVYKHKFLGIYPYLKEESHNNKIVDSLFKKFEVKPEKKNLETRYYFTEPFILAESVSNVRAVNKNGEEIGDKDVEIAFNRFKDYYNEINEKLLDINN